MSCVRPLQGWLSKSRTAKGKRNIVFNHGEALHNRPVEVPCGKCIGCKLEWSRQWALRCKHEISLYEENCFITLTYEDQHVPREGVSKEHFQRFMKRVRDRHNGRTIRFFGCGEYGGKIGRPHYHIMLFGFDFSDKRYWADRKGYRVYRSEELESIWKYGYSEVGTATFESAGYIARYCTKDYDAHEAAIRQDMGMNEEFLLMSRGGKGKNGKKTRGLGYEYFERYKEELLKHDSCVHEGKIVKIPKYYDRLAEEQRPVKMIMNKEKRKVRAKEKIEKDGRGDSRLEAEEKIMKARQQLRKGV